MKIGYASLRRGRKRRPALGKKEMPKLCKMARGRLHYSACAVFSPLRRRPTLRALDQRRLLKKAGENFCADIAVKSPTNQNLECD